MRLPPGDHLARQRDAEARPEAPRAAQAPRRDRALRRRRGGPRRGRRGRHRARPPPVGGHTIDETLLADVSTLPHPARAIGVYRRNDLPAEQRETCLGLWQLTDPGNVGTLIRTADAFGAGVALSAGCADPTSPKALRAPRRDLPRPAPRVGRAPRASGCPRAPTAGSRSARRPTPRRCPSSSAPSAPGCRTRSSRRASRLRSRCRARPSH